MDMIQSLPDSRPKPVTAHAKVTVMLLVVSFAWLLLTTPFIASGFIFAVGYINVEHVSLLMPFKAVAFLLLYTNHAVNFYLYCLTGRKFRRELVDTLTVCRRVVAGRCGPQPSSRRLTLTTGTGKATTGTVRRGGSER